MTELEKLKEHIKTMAKIGSKPSCEKCNGTGWVMRRTDEGDFFSECSCGLIQQKHQNRLLSFANIPETFKNNYLSNFETSVYSSAAEITEKLKVFNYFVDEFESMKEKGMGLYIFSATKGSGKTRIVSSIANELLEKGVQVKFATSVEIINAIKSTWDDKRSPQAENESDLLKALQETEVLIVDDFGTEKVKDWMLERWYAIINKRYVDKKVTLFTSNMSLDDLKYDDRITNRIKERTYAIHFPEESVREKIAKQNHKDLRKEI